MKATTETKSLTYDIGVAAIITLVAVPLRGLLEFFFFPVSAFVLTLFIILLTYLVSLFAGAKRKCRSILLLVFVTVLYFSLSFFVGPSGLLIFAILAIWLARSSLNYSSVLLSGCDLMLTIASGACAAFVFQAHGVLPALWTFLLLQGATRLLPTTFRPNRFEPAETEDAFVQAHRSAELAMRRLVQNAS